MCTFSTFRASLHPYLGYPLSRIPLSHFCCHCIIRVLKQAHTQTHKHTHIYIHTVHDLLNTQPPSSHSKHAKSCLLLGRVQRCTETEAQHRARVSRVNNSVIPQPEKSKSTTDIFFTSKTPSKTGGGLGNQSKLKTSSFFS